MYITPLLLLVPEFAADFCEENEQLFDAICLRKYEDLDDIINEIRGDYEKINFADCIFSGGCLGATEYINNVRSDCSGRGFALGSGSAGFAFGADIFFEFGNGSACVRGFGDNYHREIFGEA